MRRPLLISLAVLGTVVVTALALGLSGVLVLSFGGGISGAPTLPPCETGLIAEGLSYRFRDPRRGEMVNLHIRGEIGGVVTPDPDGGNFVAKRMIGVPGDTVSWRGDRVLVNGSKVDDIPTPPFEPVRLGRDEYFVLGDNRNASQDSRAFGPVPRPAIFSRVILVSWPLDRFGPVGYDKELEPPGTIACD